MKDRLKAGLVGCGYVSTAHMEVYSMLRDKVEVVGLCDSEAGRARTLANRFGIRDTYSDHKELLERRDLDFIDICTPTPTHAQIAVDAAKEGVRIITEKPMARTSDECRQMIEEAQKNNVSLCVCHTRLFSPSVLATGRIISENNWKVHSCTIATKYSEVRFGRRDWTLQRENGGPLWEMGSHAVYLQRRFLGEIGSVFASSRNLNFPANDRFGVLMRADSGAIGMIELAYGTRRGIEVYTCSIETTSEDEISLDLTTESVSVNRATAKRGFAIGWSRKMAEDLKKMYKSRIVFAARFIVSPTSFYRRSHLNLISSFVDRIKSNSRPPVSGEDGLRNIQVLEAIEASAEKGIPVSV